MIALLLAGCAWLTDEELQLIRDADSDGVPGWEDCDDADEAVGAKGERYEDADGDGVGGASVVACPAVGVATGGDCDDADGAVGLPRAWYVDGDEDGYTGTTPTAEACDPPEAGATDAPGPDCDDAAVAVSPDATEACNNGVDDDCDAATDECDLRDAGLVLHVGGEGGGLGGFPSFFLETSSARHDLVIARPYAQSVESYPGAAFPLEGELLLGDPDWVLRDGPVTAGSAFAGGDMDGDGVAEFVVGASGSTDQEPPYGPQPVVAWLRGPVYDGDSSVDETFLAETGTSELGHALAIGDLDGDAADDLAIAAPGGEGGCGAVYVAYGGATFPEWAQVNAWYNDPVSRGLKLYADCDDAAPEGGLGTALVAIPAGVEEVRPALLALGDPNAQSGYGAVYLWRQGTVPTEPARILDLSASPDVATWTGVDDEGLAGVSIATGDLDADGHADLVTGAMYAGSGAGRAYVLLDVANLPGGSLAGADVEVRGEPSESKGVPTAFGFSVAIVPDVDEDGYDELAVGAPLWSGTRRGQQAGAVYLFHGPPSDPLDAVDADVRLYGSYRDEEAGWTLDAGGDLDGDGAGDLLIGAQGWSPDGSELFGAIVVLYGAGW